jgi:hypothetical protein
MPMEPLPHPSKLDELRRRLRRMRIFIAGLDCAALNDLDSLLSVAESEVERTLTDSRRQDTRH